MRVHTLLFDHDRFDDCASAIIGFVLLYLHEIISSEADHRLDDHLLVAPDDKPLKQLWLKFVFHSCKPFRLCLLLNRHVIGFSPCYAIIQSTNYLIIFPQYIHSQKSPFRKQYVKCLCEKHPSCPVVYSIGTGDFIIDRTCILG